MKKYCVKMRITNVVNLKGPDLTDLRRSKRKGMVTCLSYPDLKYLKNKIQLDATYYFIVLLIGLTYFGHCYAHHQELATIMLIITLVVSFLVCCRLEVRCG